MKEQPTNITSLLFILLLVCIGLFPIGYEQIQTQKNNQTVIKEQLCQKDTSNWPAAKRRLCAKGIYINSDTATQLESLPQIGPKRAKAIVEYRERYGPFSHLQELSRVSGIGQKTVKRIAPWIEDLSLKKHTNK